MIYFDNASTTQASTATAKILVKYATEMYYNPSSMYHEGIAVKSDIEAARESILFSLRGEGGLVFTSGGTESDNLALFGTKKQKGGRIVISATEHAAVYYGALELKKQGFNIEFCPTDESGKVVESEFIKLIDANTSLISLIHVNNETGAINDIAKLCKIAKDINPNVIFHSDGVQALGKISVNLRALGVDLYSLSAHKIHGAKGTGALFFKKGIHLSPLIIGGGQENGLRSSTENSGGIVAFAEAVKNACINLNDRQIKSQNIKAYISKILAENIDELIFISPKTCSSDFILTIASAKVRGEVMQHALEKDGIMIGTGSACSSNKASSRIAKELSLKGKYIDGVMRISFCEYNTLAEAELFAKEFLRIYKELAKYGS